MSLHPSLKGVLSKDENRPSLQWARQTPRYTEVTNGHVLVRMGHNGDPPTQTQFVRPGGKGEPDRVLDSAAFEQEVAPWPNTDQVFPTGYVDLDVHFNPTNLILALRCFQKDDRLRMEFVQNKGFHALRLTGTGVNGEPAGALVMPLVRNEKVARPRFIP